MLVPCIDAAEELVELEVKVGDSDEGATAWALKTCGPWTDSSVGWADDEDVTWEGMVDDGGLAGTRDGTSCMLSIPDDEETPGEEEET